MVVWLILINLCQNKGFHLVLIENVLFLCSLNDTKRLKSDENNSIMNISACASWISTSNSLFTQCYWDCDLSPSLFWWVLSAMKSCEWLHLTSYNPLMVKKLSPAATITMWIGLDSVVRDTSFEPVHTDSSNRL